MHRRTFLPHTGEAAIAFGILRNLPACATPGKAGGSKADQGFLSLRDRYFLKALELNPVTATYLGGDGYDPSLAKINSRLRDYRPPALGDEATFYKGIQKDLAAIDPTKLSSVSRVDHQVMTAQLRFMLHQLEELKQYQRAIDTYVAEPFRGVDWQIQGMTPGAEGSADLGNEDEWGLVVERVRAIPPYLDVAKANLEAGKAAGNLPDHRMVERDGVNGSKANAEYFRTTLYATAKGFLGSRPFAAQVLGDLESSGRQAADAWEDLPRSCSRPTIPRMSAITSVPVIRNTSGAWKMSSRKSVPPRNCGTTDWSRRRFTRTRFSRSRRKWRRKLDSRFPSALTPRSEMESGR